jgi:hypothetical protein
VDITDWITAGGDAALLYQWVDTLPDWSAEAAVAKTVPLVQLVFPFPMDENAIPRRQWIIPGFLLRRYLSVLVAPPGIGKSLLTLQIGMAAASGITWAGWRPRKRPRILFINSEDDEDEMRRRLVAARKTMAIEPAELRGLAFAQQAATIVVAKADARTKTVVRTPMAEAIIATVIENAIDILIVDPFAETFEGDENSNSELKWAAALWREIARRTNAAVLLVHHTKKYGAEAGNPDASRGASALTGVARVVSTLFPMTEKEAETMDIDPDDRNSYLRFDDAKANMTLVTFAARWFKKKTFTLDNAGDDEPADEVGVLIPWSPPDPFDAMDGRVANKILDKIDRGTIDDNGDPTGDPYCLKNSGEKNDRWAARAIQTFIKCSDKEAMKQLKKWVKNGVLQEYEAAISTSKGKLRKCLRVVATHRPGTTLESSNVMKLVAPNEPV